MSNFVPPLKLNTVSKERHGEKDENSGTLRSSVYKIVKAVTAIDDILKSVILFSDKK